MGLVRKHFDDRESWLAGRAEHNGIGGSDAAAAIGLSPWQTPLELWKIKTGQSAPKDLSGNPAIEKGVKWEPILRRLFADTHPEFCVEYYPYDILYQSERPWLFSTLDAELYPADAKRERYFDKAECIWKWRYPAGTRRGILEIKTASPYGKAKWDEWANGNIPQNYMVQVLQQLLATGFDFAILFACLFSKDGSYTIKPYEIEREDHEEDIQWLLQEETRFWRYVRDGVVPPQRLIL